VRLALWGHVDIGGKAMKLGQWTIAAALVIGTGIALQPAALAKGKKGGGSKTPPPQQTQQQETPAPETTTPPTTQPDDTLSKAAAAMDAAEKKVRAQYESGDDWKTASDNYTQAHDAYHAATSNLTATLKTRPDYIAAVATEKKDEDDLDALRNTGNATEDQISAAAENTMNARTAVTKLEASATTSDPTIVDAKAKLTVATAALADQRKKEDLAVSADPDWQTAKKQYDDAKGNLASAK
jgi:hypothetical protein